MLHELLIVLTAVNFPAAVESHGGRERVSKASLRVSLPKSAAPFINRTYASYLIIYLNADKAVINSSFEISLFFSLPQGNKAISPAAGDNAVPEL